MNEQGQGLQTYAVPLLPNFFSSVSLFPHKGPLLTFFFLFQFFLFDYYL